MTKLPLNWLVFTLTKKSIKNLFFTLSRLIPFHLTLKDMNIVIVKLCIRNIRWKRPFVSLNKVWRKIHLKLGSYWLLLSFRMNCMILVVQSNFSLLPKKMQRIQKKFSFALQPFIWNKSGTKISLLSKVKNLKTS